MKDSKFNLKDIFQTVLIMIVILGVKFFVIDSSVVMGQSMYPTLNENSHNDRVIVERYKQFTKNYNRGDVVVLKANNEAKDKYIKRVIALSNETVEIRDGSVYVNGEVLIENYLPTDIFTEPGMKIVVPEGYVFVLGDNRIDSTDSRELGPINIEDILGRASFKFNILNLSFKKLY